jgi:hypothetical protein
VSITLQSIGDKGERHRQHSCPASTNHQERNELQILVVQEWDKGKAHTTDNQADRISHLGTLELGKHYHPQHTAHSLNGKENAHPVAGILECLGAGIGSIPYSLGNGTRRIVPQIEEACPAEELHQSHLPEGRGSALQKAYPVGLAFFLLLSIFGNSIILGVFLRIPLLHFHRGIDDTEDKDGCAHIERPDHRVGHNSFLGIVFDAQEGKKEGEYITGYRTRIAEETLNGVSLRLLFLIHHVAHQHLERLHRHIDARIKKHQGYQSKNHRTANRQTKRTGIRQKTHHQDSQRSSHKEIRNSSAETAPCLVAQGSDNGLHQDSHQWRENPEITQIVWVSTQRCKDSGDVGALKSVGYLYPEESETQVPEFPETQIRFCHHIFYCFIDIFYLVVPRTTSLVLITLFSTSFIGIEPSTCPIRMLTASSPTATPRWSTVVNIGSQATAR